MLSMWCCIEAQQEHRYTIVLYQQETLADTLTSERNPPISAMFSGGSEMLDGKSRLQYVTDVICYSAVYDDFIGCISDLNLDMVGLV